MAGTRNLPFDVRDLARSLVPIVLLSLGAAVPQARFAVLFVIATGTAIAVSRDAPVRWTWAGAVPVAVSLFWGTFATPVSGPDLVDCEDPVLAGLIALRTRSLLIPIAIHIGLDIPIYFAFACGS
jgi:hypothetical protein